MPLTFSWVRTIAEALTTGIMRSVNWLFRMLTEDSARRSFLSHRFPNMPEQVKGRLYERLQQGYQQGLAATRGEMPNIGQIQQDPSHASEGRIAVHVFVTARGWQQGSARRGRPPDLFSRFVTLYYNSVPSLADIEANVEAFAAEQITVDYDRQFRGTQVDITSVSFQIINLTRSS